MVAKKSRASVMATVSAQLIAHPSSSASQAQVPPALALPKRLKKRKTVEESFMIAGGRIDGLVVVKRYAFSEFYENTRLR